ncbi:uncharacterized protein Triagg1_1547 [Trichoderma aggressivum f. europaeum]|uniref:Uncharacterized protein n=1 Tax=Trichoderma aggressivum f. europaeum TaxID=173218 RepID=A0AAE1IIY5_9HYPO|nr:hypothetical protein Triagg1_1547 [Trichoderma aggressivum f. europaeum]
MISTQNLQQQLNSVATGASDEVVIAVLTSAAYANLIQEPGMFQVHMDGLSRIIQLKGGEGSLHSPPLRLALFCLFNGSEQEVPPTAFFFYVDVRDFAEAHVQAFEKPADANQRYLIAASAYSYQQICDIIRAKFPGLRETTPKGETGAPIPPSYIVDTTKANTDLGVKYRSLEDTVMDAVNTFQKIEKV